MKYSIVEIIMNIDNPLVLIVDDSPSMRKATRIALKSMPELRIEDVSNGLEALEFLQVNPVDLMILDLNMPEMNGEEVLRLVRKLKRFQTLPVIVLTTCDDIHNRVTMQSLGASTYMNKPVDPDELIERVKRLLIIRKLSR